MYTFLLALPQGLVENAKPIALGVVGAVLLLALIFGVVRGFYRTSRKGIKFVAVLALFFFVHERYAAQVLEKLTFLNGKGADIQTAAKALVALLAAVLIVNIVFGIIDETVKFFALKKMKNGVNMSRLLDLKSRKKEQKKIDKCRKPNIFSRLFGGVACVLNVALCLAFIAALALFACSFVPKLVDGNLAGVYAALPEKAFALLQDYALDSLAVLVIVSVAYCGYRSGVLNGARSIVLTFGIFAAILFGLFLPFSPWTTEPEKNTFIVPVVVATEKFAELFAKNENLASWATLLGKLCTGVSLAIIFVLVIVIACAILKLIARTLRRFALFRLVDGTVCFAITFVLGLAMVAFVAFAMLAVEELGVMKSFSFTSLFTEKSPLNNAFKELFDARILPLLASVKDTAAGFLG